MNYKKIITIACILIAIFIIYSSICFNFFFEKAQGIFFFAFVALIGAISINLYIPFSFKEEAFSKKIFGISLYNTTIIYFFGQIIIGMVILTTNLSTGIQFLIEFGFCFLYILLIMPTLSVITNNESRKICINTFNELSTKVEPPELKEKFIVLENIFKNHTYKDFKQFSDIVSYVFWLKKEFQKYIDKNDMIKLSYLLNESTEKIKSKIKNDKK